MHMVNKYAFVAVPSYEIEDGAKAAITYVGIYLLIHSSIAYTCLAYISREVIVVPNYLNKIIYTPPIYSSSLIKNQTLRNIYFPPIGHFQPTHDYKSVRRRKPNFRPG